jgi:hypothetical protein
MFIILFAHIPSNPFADWIPARFGFSDATEIFVFCSGMASALAFGRMFDHAGLLLGTARIVHRIWQVYWAHVAIFVAVVAALAFADQHIAGARYLRQDLNLGPLLDEPAARLLGFVTLTYVPNYFDILPMYLGILALIPLVMFAERTGGRCSSQRCAAVCGGLRPWGFWICQQRPGSLADRGSSTLLVAAHLLSRLRFCARLVEGAARRPSFDHHRGRDRRPYGTHLVSLWLVLLRRIRDCGLARRGAPGAWP